jgi:hypothetical protein
MNAQTVFAAFFLFSCVSNVSAEELIRLTRQATSPQMGYTKGGFGSMGTEKNLAGWLVLNGASFKNSECPELAKTLRETYAQTNGYVPPDPETTPLTNAPHESKPTGEIVRGFAICPTPAICRARRRNNALQLGFFSLTSAAREPTSPRDRQSRHQRPDAVRIRAQV